MEEIIAIQCSNCSDIWKYHMVGLEEDIEFLGIETDCWKCGSIYYPCNNAILMDEFVFDAIKRCDAKH